MSFFKEHLGVISLYFFIFFWTTIISPFSCVVWLLAPTIHYFYINEPKKAAMLWGFYFYIWYSFFTYFLLDFNNYIVFGEQKSTAMLLQYIVDKPDSFIFKRFCHETIVIFDRMCKFIGVVVNVPPFYKGQFFFFFGTILCDLLGDMQQASPQLTKELKKKFKSFKK